ncbi:MAG: GHKL domain-containing protein, partial [Magnetococcales bacterium]|nr:GHKL domain-containing protein [Magnetococcales bacterium]
IGNGSKRITEIVATLKSHAKGGQPGVKAILPANAPVKDALTILLPRLKKGGEVMVDIPEGLQLPGNRQQLSQVFINLITNALDAMSEHGQPPKEQKITISCTDKRGRLLYKVKDNGPGIPAAILPKIFEPFFTTKGETVGTGLGLSIVTTILNEHGGKISAVCPLEGGSEFQIMLPAAGEGG